MVTRDGNDAFGVGGDDPARLLAMVDEERRRAQRAIDPDPRLIFGVWGAAWLLGLLAMWTAAEGRMSFLVAGPVFGVLIAGAIVVTIVHTARRTAGVRGVSSQTGARYGWAWFLAFVALFAIMNGVMRIGVPDEVVGLLWTVLSGLIVGVLYLAGGALWQDPLQYRLGVWILVSSAIGALAGYPGVYLVMAVGGGGGFLVAAAWYALRERA